MNNKPNILLILADDLGWTDLGCYGSDFYETPNIDRLCKEGVKFTDAYSAAPVCSATRASILTGWTPARQHLVDVTPHLRDEQYYKGFTDYSGWDSEPEYMEPEAHQKLVFAKQLGQIPVKRHNFAKYLKQKDYKTAFIGKWHCGPDKDKYPEKHGFDINIGGNHFGWPPSYHSPYHNEYLSDCEYGSEYLTDRLTEEAVNFMKHCVQEDTPFMCYLPHYAVHTPLQGKEEYVKYFIEKEKNMTGSYNPIYAAMIKSLDDSVGRLLESIREMGIEDDTAIIFTSDNGGLGYPPGYFNKESFGGYDFVTSLKPLRGFKASLYEGGIRVPMMIKWKKHFSEDVIIDEPVYSCDIYSTILDICGFDAEVEHPVDGKSLVPILKDNKNELKRDCITFFFPWYSWLEAYELDDYLNPCAAIRAGEYKLIKLFEGGRMLFNLKKDISEAEDLSGSMKELADKLEDMLMDKLKEQNAHYPIFNKNFDTFAKERYISECKR